MLNGRSFFNFCAFIATVCIGISLAVGKIGIGSISGIFSLMAQIIAYMLCAISSFFYVHKKRRWPYYLVWAISVILIIVILVIGAI